MSWRMRSKSNVLNVGPEFQCLEGKYKNSNVWKNKVRIPVFMKKFHCLQWKDNIRIPVFVRIGPEFKCSEGWGENSKL